MKYKLLRYSLLSLLVMLCGNVFAEKVTLAYSGTTTSNMTGNNDAALFGLSETEWGIFGAKGGNSNFPGLNKDGDIRLYYHADGGNTLTVQAYGGVTIDSIAITYTGTSYSNAYVAVNGENVEISEGVYPINGRAFVVGNANTSSAQVRIKEIVINYTNPNDSRTATTIELGEYQTTGFVGERTTLPTATIKAGETTVADAAIEWSSSKTDVATIIDGLISFAGAGSTTITATYAGDDTYKPSSASYTLTVTAAPYTSIAAMLNDITSTRTNITFNFTDMVVTYVNGKYTYVHQSRDGDILLYGENLGLTAEQVYNGTLTGQLYTYNGLPEIAVNKDNISATASSNIIMVDIAVIEDPDNLSNYVNKRCDIQAEYVSASGQNLTFKAKDKEFTVRNAFGVDVASLEAGKTYNLSGIGSVYNTTYQLYLISFTGEQPQPATYTLTFAAGEGEGELPEAMELDEGTEVEVEPNTNLYKEGYTLTGWSDGTNTYKVGDKFTMTADMTLTAQFEANTVSLADRKSAVHMEWFFGEKNGAGTINLEGKKGFIVTQAEVNGQKIDVKMDIDATNGKFNNVGRGDEWAQVNSGTKLTIPSCKDAFITMSAYSEITTTTIDGQNDYTPSTSIGYKVASSSETVDIVIGDGGYYCDLKVDLPVVQQEQTPVTYENEAATIEWAMDNAENPNASTHAPEGAFSTVALSFDDSKVKIGDSKGNVLYSLTNESAQATGVTGIVFSPSAKEDLLTWNVKPAAGLTFTPTKLSGYVNRDGTDVEKGLTISAYTTGNAPTVLGTWTALRRGKTNSTTGANATTKAYDATAIYKYEIELTPDQQANFASADGFFLTATVGVGSGKSAGFGKVIIEGLLNGTAAQVEKFSLTARSNIEEAGSVTVYPAAETYEAGTEVTLTATDNFGYDFVNWTNAAGEEVSTEAKFKYTLNSNETLTANFKQVETYELNLTIDGTNEYMVTIDPMPTIVDEKAMYEAGTAVQLTANQYEGLVTFTNWSDGETSSSKTIKMDADVTLEAFFAEADIIAGWDFYKKGNSGRVADFSSADNETAALSLTNAEGETKGWLDKSTEAGGGYEGFKGAAVNWTTGSSNGDVGHYYWQTKVNAEAFTDINIQFQMLYNYNAYQKYNVDYSLNGTDWTNVGSITMSGAKSIASFAEILPAEANNQKDLYIRMIADKSSSVDGTASANDGNALAMFFITGTPKLVDDGIAPVLVSSVPANDATGASSAGKIVLNFDEKVKVVAEGSVASLSATPESSDPSKHITLTPTVSGKTITFEYKGLEYATKYYFLLNGNTVSDLTDNLIADPITFSFTTMERPAVTKGSFDAVVSNVEELQAALKAAETRADQNTRFRIFLKNGTYKFPQSTTDKTYNVELKDNSSASYTKKDPITYFNASNVSMIGESRDGVIITNTTPAEDTFEGKYGTASIYEGIGNSDVIQIGSRVSGLYWQDLTVKTGLGDARGRDIAIQDKGRMNIYKNTCLWGYQDTWTSNNDNGLYYFEGGKVRGRTDFLCGKGDMFLNGVDIQVCMATGGYIAVPSKSIKYGFVFKDCTIKGESSELNGKFTLGRPWGQGTPIALWIDTKMEIVPSAAGWNEMSGGWPMRFAEFNSMTANGTPVDLSGRKKTFGDGHENNPVLTAAEALEAGDLHNMFGEWDPTLATEQAPAPKNVKIEGTTLTWDDSQYAFCWAVVKNGSVVDFTTEPAYTIDEAGAIWSVRAANEMGGLGEAIEATAGTETAISTVGKTAAGNTIFDLQGRKVQTMKRGLYIINGKKVVK